MEAAFVVEGQRETGRRRDHLQAAAVVNCGDDDDFGGNS